MDDYLIREIDRKNELSKIHRVFRDIQGVRKVI
jgi:hypothetical protein